MSTAERTIEVVNGEGANTRIHYVMTSSGRKLSEGDVVLEGRISQEDIEEIQSYMAKNEGFSPNSAGVPDLSEKLPMSWVPKGDERHDISRIGYTSAKPTSGAVHATDFASGFSEYEFTQSLAM